MMGIGNSVAFISVSGEISYGSSSDFVKNNFDSFKTLFYTVNGDPNIKTIVLKINSWGGSPVASEEILGYINTSENH